MGTIEVNVKTEITEKVKVSLPMYFRAKYPFTANYIALTKGAREISIFHQDGFNSINLKEKMSNIDKYFDPKQYERIEEVEFIEVLDKVENEINKLPALVRETEIY